MEKVYIAVRKSGKYNADGEVTYEGMMVILGVYESDQDAENVADEDYYKMMDNLEKYELEVYDGRVELIDCYTNVVYSWDVLEWKVGKVGRFDVEK